MPVELEVTVHPVGSTEALVCLIAQGNQECETLGVDFSGERKRISFPPRRPGMEVSSILGDRDHTDPPPLGPEDNTCSLSSEPIFIEVTHTQEVFLV